jgi:hypothetical protein
MHLRARTFGAVLAAAAVAVVAFVGIGSGSASAGSTPAATRPCSISNVSFYFGGAFEGLGQRSFQITLLAHDGVTCSLSDTPLFTVTVPSGQTQKFPLYIGGRGGTLVLRTNSPLHTTVSYNAPDTTEDTSEVQSMTLAMPDGTSASTNFLQPGVTALATTPGIGVTSWDTGIGQGQEASDH